MPAGQHGFLQLIPLLPHIEGADDLAALLPVLARAAVGATGAAQAVAAAVLPGGDLALTGYPLPTPVESLVTEGEPGLVWRALAAGTPLAANREDGPEGWQLNDGTHAADVLDRWALSMGATRALAVPAAGLGRRNGVILVWWADSSPVLGPVLDEAVPVLTALAVPFTLAMERIWLQARERDAAGRCQQLNAEMARQRTAGDQFLAIHQAFTKLVRSGGEAESAVETLGSLLERGVLLLDDGLHVVAAYTTAREVSRGWSEVLEQRRLPPTVAAKPEVQRTLHLADSEPAMLDLSGFPPLWLAALRAGEQACDYLLLPRSGAVLTPFERQALEQAGNVLVLHRAAQRARWEVAAQLRGDFVLDLVAGNFRSEAEMVERARQLGCDLSRVQRLVLLDPEPGSSGGGAVALAAAVGTGASAAGAFIVPCPPGALLLVPREANAVEVAVAARERVRSTWPQLSAVVSHRVQRAQELGSALEGARRALALARRLRLTPGVVDFEALGPYRVLLEINRREVLADMVEQTLGALLRTDPGQSAPLLETAAAYLRNDCNLQQTAAACHVHVNTVKYRLKRIRETTALDLNRHEDRFRLDLAIRAWEVMGV